MRGPFSTPELAGTTATVPAAVGTHMRYVRFQLVPPDGTLHPIEADLRAAGVETRAIHHFRMLADGTAVTFHELVGDRAAVEAVATDHPDVRSHDVAADGTELFVHTRFEPNELTASVYGVAQSLDLVLDMPMTYTDRGALRITAIGELATFRDAMDAVPEDVGLRLLDTGEYDPEGGELYGALTERQQAILRTAVAAGYYREPREATLADLAEELDVAAGTVGEHLRKIEAELLTSVVP